MGRSPGKWIKTLLFGKKSARSHTPKGRDALKSGNDKGYNVGKGPSTLAVTSPVISEPVLVSTNSNGMNSELEKPSSLSGSGSGISPIIQGEEEQAIAGPGVTNDPEKIKEEQAAIKAQAAFRGFLARRAFHALKGIIRLQALVRGHLVRRQAVVTLRSTLGIIKLQALVRGQRVRSSTVGLEIQTKFCQGNPVVTDQPESVKDKLYTNTFVCKLLSPLLPAAMPLQIQYEQGEPNSVFSWLERWTSSRFWNPPSQPKKASDSKSHPKRGSYAMETESGRPKRSVRRNSAASVDSGQTNTISESEKTKRNTRKVSSSPADALQEHPQTELEKIKRNLRKVSSSMTDSSDRPENETEKPSRSLKTVSNSPSDIPDQSNDNAAEKAKKDTGSSPETKPDVEVASKSVEADMPVDALLDDHAAVELHQLQNIDKEENLSLMNGELSTKEEQTCNENQKSSKRRASFSVKSEYAENGLQSTPTLPSYMAATESAKAKLRAQNSPRLASDSADKNGITRRHSLPSSTNGKVSSHSPRTQRLVQTSSKGGVRSDRSLLSSRDGTGAEKLVQVEWRR